MWTNLLSQRLSRAAIAAATMLMSACSTHAPMQPQSLAIRNCSSLAQAVGCPPLAPREFRAVWVATVANIDWPSKPGLTTDQQKAEAVAILNRVQALNMNAVLLQVRPSADALYASNLEPWAEWLTGEQGRAPGYDPLAFWIVESHKRGLELHAWLNPFRARRTKALSANARDHVSARLPNATKKYGDWLWLDPGEKSAQDHTLAVIMDVLRRYDIDGIHFDDYFYPYPIVDRAAVIRPTTRSNAVENALSQGVGATVPGTVVASPERELDFPDEPSWQMYVASGGKLTRADWRRDNVNRFVERAYASVKAEKPWVRVGISPFGIGRPDRRPPGIVGFSQYDKLYADVELWLQRGWLDYLAPQLYWPTHQTPQAFGTLLDYWHSQNTLKRDLFPGLYTSQLGDLPRSWDVKEIENQIALVRAKRDLPQGHIHYSAIPIVQNRRNVNLTLNTLYSDAALNTIAHFYRGNSEFNAAIDIGVKSDNALAYSKVYFHSDITLNPVARQASAPDLVRQTRGFAVYLRYGERWQFALLPAAATGSALRADTRVATSNRDGVLNAVAVSIIDRYGRESVRSVRDVAVAAP